MNLRALLPIICIALLTGCQPKVEPSKEYLEALKDFDAITVQTIDKEFEFDALMNAGESDKAQEKLSEMKKLSEKSSAVIERILGLRPSIPDSKLYAEAMKEQQELEEKLKSLEARKKNEPLESLKAEALETQRKLYDAIERSNIHRPNN